MTLQLEKKKKPKPQRGARGGFHCPARDGIMVGYYPQQLVVGVGSQSREVDAVFPPQVAADPPEADLVKMGVRAQHPVMPS